MTLTPKEMKKRTEEGKKKAAAQAAEEERKRAAAYQARLDQNMSYMGSYIKTVEYHMEKAGPDTSVRVKVNSGTDWTKRNEYEPVLQTVVDHFTGLGFKADYKFDNQTEYYGDGAGPGEDFHIITVDWSDE